MSEELKHKIYSSTECLSEQTMFDYIDNKLSAKERHVVEKHVLDCELCSDAMEGLELVKDRNRISVINKTIDKHIAPIAEKEAKVIPINYKAVFSIAAGIALLIGGIFFFKNFTSSQLKNSDVAEILPPKDQTPPPPPPAKEAEETPPSPANDAPAITTTTNEREQGPQTKSLGLKNKEGQLESAEDLKQEIVLAEGKEKDKKENSKTTVASGATTSAPTNTGTYSWNTNENAANGAKLDDAIAKQQVDDRKVVTLTPAPVESTVNVPMGGAGESNKDQLTDESKKAEEKVVTHNNLATTPSYGYTNQTAKPDQNQEQKDDKSNSNGDEIALAKKSEKSGKYRAESETKGKDKKLAENKSDEDAAGTVAYEPQSISTVSDKEVVQTETKAPAVTTVTNAATADNTIVDGFFYKENADSVYTIVDQMPQYTGGEVEMMKFIQKNLNYPSTDDEGNIIATVNIEFTINTFGKAVNPKLIKPKSSSLEKQVISMVNKMPAWKPGKQKGKNVSVKYHLPVKVNTK